ncbi:MAG: hypothetical protein CMJ50_00175 [Planctomycetaceae bacterium]|nr:hypothetical protein [Planctomycetaceae bacterium]
MATITLMTIRLASDYRLIHDMLPLTIVIDSMMLVYQSRVTTWMSVILGVSGYRVPWHYRY